MLKLILAILIEEGLIDEKRGKFIYSRMNKKPAPDNLEDALKQLREFLK